MKNHDFVEALTTLFYNAVNEDVQYDDSVLQAVYLNHGKELGGVTTSIEDGELVIYLNNDKQLVVSINERIF